MAERKTDLIKWLTIFNTVGILVIGSIMGYVYLSLRPSKAQEPQVVKDIDMRPLVEATQYKGANDPKVNIVIFNSFTCGFCKKSREVIHQVLQKHPDKVRLVYRHFSRNEMDEKAGMAAECAGDQNKFWQMYDTIYSDDESSFNFQAYAQKIGVNVAQFNQCLNSNKYLNKVSADTEMGRTLGVQGTPTFVVNGEMMVGFRPLQSFETAIKKYL